MREYCLGGAYRCGLPYDNVGKTSVNDFESRFREALRRRVYPNAPVYLKEIAASIGRSENTVLRWWRGATKIAADDLYRLTDFFTRRGDRRFLHEIFGDLLPERDLAIDDDEAILTLARHVLRRAGEQAKVNPDTNLWFTAEGSVVNASLGHADFVRAKLGLAENRGNLPAYATRVLGWVGVTERVDGVVVIRHDGRHVAPLAAERVCEWLEDHGDRIAHVRRAVLIDGKWIEGHHYGAQAALNAIAKVAFIVRMPRQPWSVKRLPLDVIADTLLKKLLRTHHQEPSRLIHVAAQLGAFTTSSLFGVDGDNVVSHHIATGFGFDPSVEGLNVLSRPDTEYALMIQARVLQTKREGPTYYELIGTIDDRQARYFNLALPEPGPSGRILTSSVVLQLERIAA